MIFVKRGEWAQAGQRGDFARAFPSFGCGHPGEESPRLESPWPPSCREHAIRWTKLECLMPFYE